MCFVTGGVTKQSSQSIGEIAGSCTMAKKPKKALIKRTHKNNGRTTVDAYKKQRPKFTGAKSATTSYELFIEKVQKPERYKDAILGLRHNHQLHEFVEWALKRLIDSKFENRFSIQPE